MLQKPQFCWNLKIITCMDVICLYFWVILVYLFFGFTAKSQEGSEGDSESEEDVDYTPIEPVDDWKKVRLPSTTTTKQWSGLIACTFLEGWFTDLSFVWSLFQTIQVGSDYQATVPDGLCKYGDAPGNVSSVDMMYIAWWIHKHFWVIIPWIKMINLISSAIFWGIICWIVPHYILYHENYV